MSPRRFLGLSALIIVVLGLSLYGHTAGYGFVELDDPLLVLQNPIAQSLTVPHVKAAFSMFDPELYIPLTFVSYQIDGSLGGLHPFLFHLHNIVEHLLNAWLLCVLAWMLTRKRLVALCAALLFLVHPLNAEAVLWVSGRKDLLAATFFLLSLIAYVRFLRTRKSSWYGGSLFTFLCGLLSKVSAISLPFVLFLVDAIEKRTVTRRSLLEKIPYVALAAVFGIVALFGKAHASSLPLLTYVLTSATSLVFTVEKMLVPVGLSPMYEYSGTISIMSANFFVPLVVVLIVIAIAFLGRRRMPAFALLVFFLLLTFAPSFGNLVKDGSYYLGSDRYAYVPLMGMCLFAAWALDWVGIRFKEEGRASVIAVRTLGLLMIVVASALTVRQSLVWADTGTLSAYVVNVSPNARLGHLWHGNALRDAGQLDAALAEYATALSMRPDPQVYYNRALAEESQGQTDKAMADYERAIAMEPDYALAQINLGRLYYLGGKKDDARMQFESAATEAPQLAMPLYDLGVLDGDRKDFAAAADEYAKALERDPLLSDARANLGIALLELGRTSEAVDALKQTLAQDPSNSTATAAMERLMKEGVVKEKQ